MNMLAGIYCKDVRDILKASYFAAEKHRDQRRKGDGSPYINHPLGVGWILWDEGCVMDPPTIIAAILHDTVEDTNTTLDEIAREFGQVVANIVAEVTDDKELPKVDRKKLQIEHARKASHAARNIKLADKLHNLRDLLKVPPQGWSRGRITGYFLWSAQVIKAIAEQNTNRRLESILFHLIENATFENGESVVPRQALYTPCGVPNGMCTPPAGVPQNPEEQSEMLQKYYEEMANCQE
jgi:guanosine-3',5'-bis(diphosphate) 3'-pyrophosphohydrolase